MSDNLERFETDIHTFIHTYIYTYLYLRNAVTLGTLMNTVHEGLVAFIRAPEACNTPNRLFTGAKNCLKESCREH